MQGAAFIYVYTYKYLFQFFADSKYPNLFRIELQQVKMISIGFG